jgi:hypothetical protein
MNPNLTIGYMAAQVKQRQVDLGAARGWMAEQTAAHQASRRPQLGETLRRWKAGTFAAPLRAVRALTGVAAPAAAATHRLDRAA